ncbi:MAG: hypothetical protein PHU12_03975 [Candidatus Aenigmarchaeota archaeon]|nr:hypothetical protein [Candidatus Aenigmarchaeota archaeon]
MQYIFVFGKNPSLSLAEIVSYLEPKSQFSILELTDQFTIIETDFKPDINQLGGTLKIAEVLTNEKEYDFYNIYKDTTGPFAVSSYTSKGDQENFINIIKKQMKGDKIKAGCLHTDESFTPHTDLIKKHILERAFEIILIQGKKFYLAKTIGAHNPYEFRKRDIERPSQRAMFAIPPRLCKIMINLSKPEGVLLDPFCGIGSILQEAVLMNLDIRGSDIDESCIKSAIENLEWLEKEYKVTINPKEKVMVGDATKLTEYFKPESIDAIVTEPDLGPPLKFRAKPIRAVKIIEHLRSLYEKTLEQMSVILKTGKRIVIILPYFEIDEKRIQMDVKDMARKNKLRIVDPLDKYNIPHYFPFLDYEERHKTIRQIMILEKL